MGKFQLYGLAAVACPTRKSDLYRDVLPLLNSGRVRLLDHTRMRSQFVNLERRTARGGKDSIDHVDGAHDDIANAVAGAVLASASKKGIFRIGFGGPGGYAPNDGRIHWQDADEPRQHSRITIEHISEQEDLSGVVFSKTCKENGNGRHGICSVTTICPQQARWPASEHVHWQRLHELANEARERVSRAHTQMDEIDRKADLSREGKERQRRRIAARAVADLEASRTLERARETVRYVVEQWKLDDVSPEIAEAKTAMLKTLKEAEAGWQRANAVLIMPPNLAARLSSTDRPLIGVRGGSWSGFPVITSSSVPDGMVILLDPTQVAVASPSDGAEIRVSDQATINMVDQDTESSVTPTAVSLTSMYQTDSTAVLVERTINWRLIKTGAAVYISGASY